MPEMLLPGQAEKKTCYKINSYYATSPERLIPISNQGQLQTTTAISAINGNFKNCARHKESAISHAKTLTSHCRLNNVT